MKRFNFQFSTVAERRLLSGAEVSRSINFQLMLAFLATAATLCFSCTDLLPDDEDKKVAVTEVTLDPATATLAVGGTLKINVWIAPADATDRNVTVVSSNTAVATVASPNGECIVTAVGAGTATITATAKDGSGKTARCEITVTAGGGGTVNVTGVALDRTTLSLKAGETATLAATVQPANATDKSVTWTSANTGIATVSATGLVTAVKEGKTTITATTRNGAKTATCEVTVTAAGSGGTDPGTGGRLVAYLYDGGEAGGTFNYEYDNQNRLTKITATGQLAGVWNVTYPTSNTVRYINANDNFTFTKNSQGYVTKYEATVKGIKATQDLEYANGYVTKGTSTSTGLTVTSVYVWNNGRLDAIENGMPGLTGLLEKITFTYTGTPNKDCYISPWTMSFENGNVFCPPSWVGKISPNLPASKTSQRMMLDTRTITYRYELDSQGYVTKVHAKEGSAAEYLLYEVRYK
jgi:hypothetical protein